MMNNREIYRNVFKKIFGAEDSVLDENFAFATTDQWDSMTHLTLINELEDQFDILFETEDILHFGSFENGMKILEKYGVNFDD